MYIQEAPHDSSPCVGEGELDTGLSRILNGHESVSANKMPVDVIILI